MSSIVVLFLAVVSFVSSTEDLTPSAFEDPDPLPPETFEFLFDNRYPSFMIMDASRYWDTDTEYKNFGFLREKIQDDSIDSETKKYAQSLMHEATRRLKNSLKKFEVHLDDKYDMYDFVREWKNIEDGNPAVHKDLYKMIEKNFGAV